MDHFETSADYLERTFIIDKGTIERLPNRTNAICDAISNAEAKNEVLMRDVVGFVQRNAEAKIFVEDLQKYLELHVCDQGGLVSSIGVSTTDDLTTEKVSPVTYRALQEQSVDVDVARSDTEQSHQL